jgi:hypothetical protein
MELRPRLRVRTFLVLTAALQLFTAAFGVSALLKPATATAVQSVPYLVNFQGRLTDNSGNVLADGSYNVKFRIWDNISAGTNRWEGDRVMGASDNRITVTNGLFNIQFGDTAKGDPALSPALFNTQTYANLYLEVELPTPATASCATNGCAVWTEGAMTPRQPLASSPYAFNSDTLDGLDSAAFGQIAANNTFTGANLFAPTTSSTVALTVKATTAGSTNALEVFDSGGTRQAFFDASGALTLGQAITAPTATNTINSLVINAGALSNVTGYAQASGGFLQSGTGTFGTGTGAVSLNGDTTVAANKNLIMPTGTGTFQQSYSSAAASSAQTLNFTNSNTAAAITMQGINITPSNANASGPTNILNIINFAAGNALGANANTNGLNFASATGYTNFIKTPTFVLSSAGAITGVNGLTVTNTTTTAITANTVTSGSVISATGISTGTALNLASNAFSSGTGLSLSGTGLTSGTGILFNTTSNAMTTGKAINITGAAAAVTADVSGALINVAPTRTLAAAATRNDSMNFLNLTRSITTSIAGSTYNLTGALANLQSTCTQTLGTCTDTANILNLNQQYASASGAVLNVQGAGTGNLATLDAANASANGVAVDVQSSGTGQFVLKLTSNNAATNVLFARADGHVGIGNTAPATALDVTGTTNATAYSVGGTAGSSATCSGGQVLQNPTLSNGIITAGSCATPSGTGAATDLSNLTSTAINQSLIANADNSLDLGSTAKTWKDVFTGNVDAGTTTTALTIGTAATTTAITVGRSGLAVSLPGGLSTSGGNVAAGTGTVSGAVINATTKFQASGVDGTASTCGGGAALTGATFSGGILTGAGSCTAFQAAGNYIVQAPTGTANTITAASGAQALIIKGTNGTGTHLLDIYNTAASPVLTSYFDQNGALTTTAAITAPTSSNTINGLVVNSGALSGITGYTQSSGTFAQTSSVTSGTATTLAVTNGGASGTNTIKGVAINIAGTANASGSDATTGLDFGNVSAATGNTYTAQNYGTGFNNLLTYNAGTVIINGTGQINGAQMQSGTVANAALANSSVTVTAGTGLSGGGGVALGASTSLSVAYGAASGTAVQGNTTLVCPSGSGNLSGGGNTITLGSGGTCNALSFSSTPTFSSLSVSGSSNAVAAFSSTGTSGSALTLDDQSFTANNANLANLTFKNANATATATTVNGLSITPTGGTNANSNANTLNGILFPNVTTVANNNFYALNFGTGYNDLLRYNNTTTLITGTGQINGAQLQATSVANGALANSSLTVTAGTGLSGGGGVALGASTSLSVAYGSAASTAVQGNVTLTCPTVSGNLTGGGGTITLGAGGSCTAIGMTATPTFTSVTSPTYTGAGAVALSSGAATALTLDSLSGNLIMGSNTTAIQKAASTFAIDLATAGTSTLTIKNSNGANVANLTVTGTISGNGSGLTALNPSNLSQGSGSVTLQSANATNLAVTSGTTGTTTVDTGTTGQVNIGTDTTNAKTIQIGPSGTNTNTTTINLGTNTAGTQDVNLGSTGSGNAAAGTLISIQGGTTASTAVLIGTNGAGGITIDSGTTGGINLGNNANAKTITIGNVTGATAVNISAGTGGINLGDDAITKEIDIGGVNNDGTDTVKIATNGTTNADSVTIGNNAAGTAVNIDAGSTGQLQIGNSAAAHNIQIGSGAAVNTLIIGSNTTTSATTIQGGSGSITLNAGNGNRVIVGSATTDTNQVLFQLDTNHVFADTATCSTTTNQGALYYNSNNNSADTAGSNTVRACVNGNWEDLVSTGGLGLLAFGVIPDSANAGTIGDLGAVSGNTNSPCKVTWSATQQVTVNPCVAYSGGRKVTVPSTALSTASIAASAFVNVCLSGANNQPALGTGNTTETSAGVPTFSANNPVLCLATVKMTATLGNVGNIWDTRTFTTTQKAFISINSVSSPGYIVVSTAANTVVTTAVAGTGPIRGIVVATSGAASSTTINGIIATAGQQYVKILVGGTATVNGVIQTAGTAGYAQTAATATTATTYAWGGILQKGVDASGACSISTNCQFAGFIDLKISR